MENFDRKKHWENIYSTRSLNEVSWYQPVPETSLEFLKQFNIPKDASIIDIGGGDSFLVDHLLKLGYTNVTVLDISATALERAKARLGPDSSKVKWIVSDASTFVPTEQYDLWHDRAAFHFFTSESDISNYLNVMSKGIKPDGILILGTFSEQGPKKCSMIEIKQYSEESMTARLSTLFKKIKCIKIDHKTPFGTLQNFLFCSFRKKPALNYI